MSHTTKVGETTFIHNGDFSGDVRITNSRNQDLVVPAGDLIGFVAEYVRQERIVRLEQMSALNVLGVGGREKEMRS